MVAHRHDVSSRVSVRWPFRILAAVIVLTAVGAIAGTAFMWWSHGAGPTKWQTICILPGAAWLIRSAWNATIHGRSSSPEFWPFATESVFIAYFIVVFMASRT